MKEAEVLELGHWALIFFEFSDIYRVSYCGHPSPGISETNVSIITNWCTKVCLNRAAQKSSAMDNNLYDEN
jgi:hypothetical protein